MNNWKGKFALLGAGQAVSMLTSSILQISIVWYLTQTTLSPTVVTLSTLAGFLPRAVLGLFTGVFIDRFDRKKILIFADLGIALCALFLAAAAAFGYLPLWLILTVLCLRSAGAAFHTPAFNAVVPTIVPKEALTRCAGITQSFESISLILSPALAAFLYNLWDLSAIILLDVAGAAVAITIVALLPIVRYATEGDHAALHIWQDTKAGFLMLRQVPGLLAVMVISTLYAFIYFPVGSMYPLITMDYFGGGVSESSVVEIAFSSGTLLGAFLLSLLGNRIRRLGGITASIGLYGLGLIITGLLPPGGLRLFILLSVFMGLTLPFFYGLRTAILQSNVSGEYLGRVLSLTYSVSLFASPLGLLFGGAFAELVGVNYCFLLCGVLAVCLSCAMLLTPSVRRSRL